MIPLKRITKVDVVRHENSKRVTAKITLECGHVKHYKWSEVPCKRARCEQCLKAKE